MLASFKLTDLCHFNRNDVEEILFGHSSDDSTSARPTTTKEDEDSSHIYTYFDLQVEILKLKSNLLNSETEKDCVRCNDQLIDWLSQPQLCPLIEREQLIQNIVKAIPKKVEGLHQLSKHLADKKKNRNISRLQVLNGIRGRSFMITLDSTKLSDFFSEIKADLKYAKATLLRILISFTAVCQKGAVSPKSFPQQPVMADQFAKLLDRGCKTVPRLNSDAKVLADLPHDEEVLSQMADDIKARPRIEMLPDLLALFFNSQRCVLMGEIEEKRLVGSVFAQSPCGQQSDLYTAFVMAVFTAAEGGLPLSSVWELLGVASVLLVPMFSAGEKTKIFTELKRHLEHCQKAAQEKEAEESSSQEPQEDGIHKDLVENHFEQALKESTLEAEGGDEMSEDFVFLSDESDFVEGASCVLQ